MDHNWSGFELNRVIVRSCLKIRAQIQTLVDFMFWNARWNSQPECVVSQEIVSGRKFLHFDHWMVCKSCVVKVTCRSPKKGRFTCVNLHAKVSATTLSRRCRVLCTSDHLFRLSLTSNVSGCHWNLTRETLIWHKITISAQPTVLSWSNSIAIRVCLHITHSVNIIVRMRWQMITVNDRLIIHVVPMVRFPRVCLPNIYIAWMLQVSALRRSSRLFSGIKFHGSP